MNKITKAIAGFVAVAAFAVSASTAGAATTAELQAQINALMAQLSATSATTVSTPAVTFTRDLSIGASGADVTALQNWLMSKGYAIPAGATGYYGAQTAAAVKMYQSAKNLPSTGYFGPLTRGAIAAENPTTTTTTTTTTGGTTTTTSTSGLSGGEASLEDFKGQDGDDDEVEEGATAQVAEFSFDVEDGDVEIDRVDLTFTTAATGSEEDEPWNTFDTITLMVNGEEVASEDVSDEDDWMENDSPFEFRFTGLNTVVKEGDEAVITVEVEAQSSVDSASTDIPWTVYIQTNGVRAMDAEGIDQYTGDSTGESVTFNVVEEGQDDELNVKRSSENPDATTLKVEASGTSDWFTVFAFDLEADEDGGDIEIDQLPVDFTVSSGEVVENMINDVKIKIDGEEFDDFDWNGEGDTFASSTFDIDKDFTIPAGETVTVEVMVEFNSPTSGGYDAGDQVTASVVGANVTGEGADDVVGDGNVTGDTHTLQTSGINVENNDKDDYVAEEHDVDGSDNDYAEFEITVDVTAFEQDVYIPTTSAAFTYQIENAAGTATSTGFTNSATVESDADTSGAYFVIDEGSTESFTFRVTTNPPAYGESSDYRMQLLTIEFNDTASAADTTWTASPASDYETGFATVAD